MSDRYIVEYCSPTLAGIKTGSLFSIRIKDEKDINKGVRELNQKLREKGLRAVPVNRTEEFMLIYLYRPNDLEKDLQNPLVWGILKKMGYDNNRADYCVVQLIRHFKENKRFPHEIGLFLSYPPEDVKGFMNSPSEGVKYIGHWKVYSNVERAKEIFRKYNKCTEKYIYEVIHGKMLSDLIVAS